LLNLFSMNPVEFYFYLTDKFQGTYTIRILYQFFVLIKLVGPYFILSVIINGILRHFVLMRNWTPAFKNESTGIFIASLAGLISPLPTYVAVPMGISLMSAGLSFSSVAAFVVASPLLNPGVFYLTLTQLGWPLALARLISTLVLALTAGFLSRFLKDRIKNPISNLSVNIHELRRPFLKELSRSFLFLGRYFFIAIFMGACVKALIPEEMIVRILGGNASTSLIVAIALGVPFYSCGGAAIPLVQVLGEMGMNRGAALAFFIAGPSTKLETLFAYRALMGNRVLAWFLVYTLAGSFLCGALFLKISDIFMH